MPTKGWTEAQLAKLQRDIAATQAAIRQLTPKLRKWEAARAHMVKAKVAKPSPSAVPPAVSPALRKKSDAPAEDAKASLRKAHEEAAAKQTDARSLAKSMPTSTTAPSAPSAPSAPTAPLRPITDPLDPELLDLFKAAPGQQITDVLPGQPFFRPRK